MKIHRKIVNINSRIKVTENIVRKANPRRVLEIGAGDYSFSYCCNDFDVWVKVDLSPPCDIIFDFGKNGVELPFVDGYFDMVICTQVLEHLLWPQDLIFSARRVLKSNGFFLCSVPNMVSLSYRLSWLFGKVPSCAASGNLPPELGSTSYLTDAGFFGGHVIDFNLKKLIMLLDYCGFEVHLTRGSGLFWRRQVMHPFFTPKKLSSHIIALASPKCSGSK